MNHSATPADKAGMQSLSRYGDILTTEDLAEVLSVSQRTIYRLVAADQLPAVHVGRRVYFPKHEVAALLHLEKEVEA